MDNFIIEGPTKLEGSIQVGGSKNAALPIIAATILAKGRCKITNVPDIADIKNMLDLLVDLGAKVNFKNNCCDIDTTNINSYIPNVKKVKHIRASVLLAGPLLARFGRVHLAHPGGCFIGARPVKTHLDVFEELGATIKTMEDFYEIKAKKLVGKKIILGEFSVTGTENALMAACGAEGITEIHLCANEPHVYDFCCFLVSMGVTIDGLGTHTLRVSVKSKLHGTSHRVIPDQIEAGTFAIMAAAGRGRVVIKNFIVSHHDILLKKLKEANINFLINSDEEIEIRPTSSIKSVNIQTQIYPGFPTDLQAPFAILLTQAEGNSEIYETMFEGRLNYINELNKMGANGVIRNSHEATITGPTPLYGTTINTLDLRAGATLIIAALIATGESVIKNANIVDRGYENIEQKLIGLGAKISRISD